MKSLKSRKYQEKFWEAQYENRGLIGPRWYAFFRKFTQHREQFAFELYKKWVPQANSSTKILDVGCGEGGLAINLATLGNEVTGIDVATNRLRIAQRKANKLALKNIQFKKVNLDNGLPFKNRAFSHLLCLGVIEYTFDPYFVLKEIHRVLKPGGFLIIDVPNIAFLPERVKLLFGILPSWPDAIGWQGGRLHSFTMKSLADVLEKTGFDVREKTGWGLLRTLRSWWASLLCGEIVIVAKKK